MASRGLTLLETMVALVILGVVVVAYLEVFGGSARAARNTETWSQAVAYAEDALERWKVHGEVAGLERPQDLPGGFQRWIKRRPWNDDLTRVTAVVLLPGGGRFELDLLTRHP